MSSLLQDLRFAFRTLANSPGFAAVAVFTLALGIGANTAVYSVVDGLMLRPLPYDEPDRIVRVLEKPPGFERNPISTLNFLDWQKDNSVFDFMAAETGETATLTGIAEPLPLQVARVSARYFDIFGIRATLGRTFLPDEDRFGRHQVVVLSHMLWTSQFGADPSIINRTLLLDGEPHAVIGVLPAGGAFDRPTTQLWRPLAFELSNTTRGFHWLTSFARLKKGVSLRQAQADMDAIGARIEKDYPDTNSGWGVIVERYADILLGPGVRRGALVLMTASGMVLLIGCANLANLALARGVAREREVAVRAAFGAGRARLMRQFLTETVLVSVCGGALGLVIADGLMRWLLAQIPPAFIAREVTVGMDVRVLLFAAAISVLTGLLFGIAPAWQATALDLTGSMKDGGRGSSGSASRSRLRDLLIVGEVALAFMLLVGAGLMMRSFFRLMNADTGIDSSNVLTIGLPLTTRRFPEPVALNLYLREVRAAVDGVPGVRATALSCVPPMQGACYGMPMQIANRPIVDLANRRPGFLQIVSPSYFTALGLTIVRGRALSDRDTRNAPPVLVINERLATREFDKDDPIGQRILIQEIVPGKTELGPEVPWEVVGVVRNERMNGMADDGSAGVYVSNEQSPFYYVMTLIVRANADPLRLLQAIRVAIHGVSRDQALIDVRTVDQIKDQVLVGHRLQSTLLGTFSTVALLLAGIGIYGVISYSVAQRTHEIGIRAALGASAGSLLGLILGRGLVLTLIGLVIGFGGAVGLTRLLTALLYGVGPRDPATMASTAAILAVVAVTACYIPARRAAKIDPMVALRCE